MARQPDPNHRIEVTCITCGGKGTHPNKLHKCPLCKGKGTIKVLK